MALRAVPDHPKFAELKAILNQPKGPVAGWLEMMWHFTGRFTPQGNIGKYTDMAIEAWVEWNGEPGALIEAFVKAGWIDRDPVHRLLVHDWAEHADKATKNALGRSKIAFCTPGVRTEIPEVGTPYRPPVPEPVPVPVPEPVSLAAGITAHQIAKEVMADAKMTSDTVLRAVASQAQIEIGEGDASEHRARGIKTAMVGAWTQFREQVAANRMEFQWTAQKFFGEGYWRDEAGWPWRNGKSPLAQAGFIPQPVVSEAEQYESWNSMSEKYRNSNPWKGMVPSEKAQV